MIGMMLLTLSWETDIYISNQAATGNLMIVIKKSLDLGTTMAVAMHRVIKVFYPNLMARVWTSLVVPMFVSCSSNHQTCQMFLTLPSQATVMIPSIECTIKLKTRWVAYLLFRLDLGGVLLFHPQ